MDEKLVAIKQRMRELEGREEELQAHAGTTVNVEAAVTAALAQIQRLHEVLTHGSMVEQKKLVGGFIAGITLYPGEDRGVITFFDLSASFKFHGGSRQKLYRQEAG